MLFDVANSALLSCSCSSGGGRGLYGHTRLPGLDLRQWLTVGVGVDIHSFIHALVRSNTCCPTLHVFHSGFADLTVKAATQAATQLQPPAPAAGEVPPLAMSSLVSSVALHSLRATCTTLQKLLLLLGYICHMGSLGSAPLTAADHTAIAADLITPLATVLRSCAAALWLCKTPASKQVPGMTVDVKSSTGGVG